MNNGAARDSLERFMREHEYLDASRELALVLQMQAPDAGGGPSSPRSSSPRPSSRPSSPTRGTHAPADILRELIREPDVDFDLLSSTEIDERLHEAVTAVLNTHSQGMLPDYLGSDCFASLLRKFNEDPSSSSGLPRLPIQTTWLAMFKDATRKLAHAILVVDVRVAGLPLVYVNEAFETLTGFAHDEAVGRNCRFLQGKATEQAAIAQLVHAIREQRT